MPGWGADGIGHPEIGDTLRRVAVGPRCLRSGMQYRGTSRQEGGDWAAAFGAAGVPPRGRLGGFVSGQPRAPLPVSWVG
jgi:hypothetical protein